MRQLRSPVNVLSIASIVATALLPGPGLSGRPVGALSTRLTGSTFVYEVREGDTMPSAGSRFGIDPREIAAANAAIARQRLIAGGVLRLDNRHIVPAFADDVALVINVPQRMLFLVDGGASSHAVEGEGPVGYPVGLGRRDWPTPLGDFTVTRTEENPTWDVPVSIQAEMRRLGRPVLQTVPPGPANPLGAFWLGLNLGAVGIHGTNAPSSIFQHTTHGCIRLHPDDIAALYPRVGVGTTGRIVYEPVLLAQTAAGIYLEAHPDVYRRMSANPMSAVRDIAVEAGIAGEVDWGEVARVLHARAGIARPVGCAR